MSYQIAIEAHEFHTPIVDEGFAFETNDIDDLLIHLETNANSLKALAQDRRAH